jgi:cell division protease FtsH
VEIFVGVGASRIRKLFSDARKNGPCIVFIDEIDAIGRQRSGGGSNMGGGNDEREQTLNQILTEMDGFEGNSGVIVLAATNRADVLDNALLRPGRFDRRVPVPLPDKKGRFEILKVHSRNKPLEENVDLQAIASRTIGFSGAQLQNLMNESAINAARLSKDTIAYAEIDQAIDRLTVGLAKANQKKSLTRQRLVAYHEAGHAVMAALLEDYDAVTKVTILPRSNGAGGFTLFTPSEERMESGMYSLKFLKGQLAVALGGRVAEELVFGKDEITTGASGDLQQVRNVARRMVTQWGFAGEELGMTAWEEAEQNAYAGKGMSAKQEAAIDRAVSAICKEAYTTCYDALKDARSVMDDLAEMLIEEETVEGDEVVKLVKKFRGEPLLEAVPAQAVPA